MGSNVLPGDEYAEFAEALEETGLYGVGAYFCDQHPDLVDRGNGHPVACHFAEVNTEVTV